MSKSLKGKGPKMKPRCVGCVMYTHGERLVRVEVREVTPRKKVKRG